MMDNIQKDYVRIYVWQIPVRFFHWMNAVCILLLSVTGYLIGKPIALRYANEAYQQYWFGTVRFVHFVAAFLFFFNFLVRIYWGFVGNQYANWKNFITVKGEDWKEIKEVLKVDIFQASLKGKISVGHNKLAGLIYFLIFLIFLFQCLTGFALYSDMSSSFLPGLFAWITPLMDGDFAVRQWHHLLMWVFIVFSIIHIYLVFYHDYVEGRGTTSSMVGGWKFEKEEDLD